MTTTAFWTTADESDDDHWFLGTLATVKARAERTGGVLSVIEFLHPAGFATPNHVHDREDEAFYVLSGSISGFCGERTWRAGRGDFIWLPRGVPHGYEVDGGEAVRTLAITVPGGFDEVVVALTEPAGAQALPDAPQMPDSDTLSL